MAQLLVRNLPDTIVAELKRRAAAHGRSAEAEHRAILEASLNDARERLIERAAAFEAELLGRPMTDAAELVRQGREQR